MFETCVSALECPDQPPSVDNALVAYCSDVTYGSIAHYECSSSYYYEETGSINSSCLANATWSTPSEMCQRG